MWWSMVNERTTENISLRNGMAVASPTCTSTFEVAVRSRRERARLRSSSRHVRCRHWGRSQSVVRPGPGPSSRTSPPKSTPFRDQGKISVPSLCLQWFDWQYQRCSRFIFPTIANGNCHPRGQWYKEREPTFPKPPPCFTVPGSRSPGKPRPCTLPRAAMDEFENARRDILTACANISEPSLSDGG